MKPRLATREVVLRPALYIIVVVVKRLFGYREKDSKQKTKGERKREEERKGKKKKFWEVVRSNLRYLSAIREIYCN